MFIPRYTAALSSAVLLAAACPAPPARAAAAGEVQSCPATAALVELYTCEGCSRPPPQWRREFLQKLTLVQDDGARVLQAVDTATCATPITQARRPQ